ncbi:hypothetical protein I3760_01G007000 [Carya illinoinensis]|nr:hypothetical protein I3760_01G007000 [Carya illinoinensis]
MPTPPSPFHFRYTPTPLLLLSCCTLPSLILKFSVNRFFYLPSLSLSQLGFVLHAFASFYFSGSVEQRTSPTPLGNVASLSNSTGHCTKLGYDTTRVRIQGLNNIL